MQNAPRGAFYNTFGEHSAILLTFIKLPFVIKIFLCPQRNFGRHIVIVLSVRPSGFVRCISPIFFEVGIQNLVCGCILGWPSVAYHFRGHCDLDLYLWLSFYSDRNVRPSVPLCVWCISPIFFEVGIPNLMCGCILGWRSVAYHFQVTVTLTPDLVFILIVSGAYHLYYLRYEFQIWCVDASWVDEVSHTIIGSLWPWPWPLA